MSRDAAIRPGPATPGPATPGPAAPGPAAPEPTAWDRVRAWRPTRRGVALAALLVVTLTVLVLAAPRGTGFLDPAAVDPAGSRAVVSVLGDLGVATVDARRTADVVAAAPGSTVVLTDPGLPTAQMVDAVLDAGPATVVLVSPWPGSAALGRLAAGVEVAEVADAQALEPGCALRAAVRAGAAELPGPRYDARAWPGAEACYDRAEAAAVVVLPARAGRPEVVLLGSSVPLTNEGLAAHGNAALALNLLGAHARLVWWRPTSDDPALAGQAPTAVTDLVPGWVLPVLVQLGVASLLAAWWRGRRFGPLVVEPLPVVVRSGETTAGRARLLQANRARGEAAEHLRAAARERIRARLGLPLGCSPRHLVAAVSTRTGRPADEVGGLLYGPQPADDAALVTTGHDLEVLMEQVGGA